MRMRMIKDDLWSMAQVKGCPDPPVMEVIIIIIIIIIIVVIIISIVIVASSHYCPCNDDNQPTEDHSPDAFFSWFVHYCLPTKFINSIIFINQPKITVRMLSPHGRLLLPSNGECLSAVVHDRRAVIGHSFDRDNDDDDGWKNEKFTSDALTIILTLLADVIGILVHIFDVLFQDINMPEMGLGGI